VHELPKIHERPLAVPLPSGKRCNVDSSCNPSGNRYDPVRQPLVGSSLINATTQSRMPGSINIVVSCSNRKRYVPQADLQVQSLTHVPADDRLGEWISRLSRRGGTRIAASNLYQGEHWICVKRISTDAAVVRPVVYVSSAGYGLIQDSSRIKAYSATFSPRLSDSVVPRCVDDWRGYVRAWWAGLGEWRPPGIDGARTLLGLAREHPRTPLIVAASAPYLLAMRKDILDAAKALQSDSLLTLISVGGQGLDSELKRLMLRCDSRLQTVLGGTLASLNTRLVAWLVARKLKEFRRQSLQRAVDRLMANVRTVRRPSRRKMHDSELRAWIQQRLSADERQTHSRLLRMLRDAGRACEQARFRSLVDDVRSGGLGA